MSKKATDLIDLGEEERRLWCKFFAATSRLDQLYIAINCGRMTREEMADEIAAVVSTVDRTRRAWDEARLAVAGALFQQTTKARAA